MQNLSVPFDRRVWMEARTLRAAGYCVSVICPKDRTSEESYQEIEGVHIFRYPPPKRGTTFVGYLCEFAYSWIRTFWLSLHVCRRIKFDIVQACNPPETLFLIGLFYRLFGKRFIFDQHDLSPETFATRFGRRPLVHRVLLLLEKWTYQTADVVITTSRSISQIALRRGGLDEQDVFLVLSAPDPQEIKPVSPDTSIRGEYRYCVAYLGIIGPQDGVDYLVRSAHWIVKEARRSDVRFVAVGDGDALPSVERLATELGISEYFWFPGRISWREGLAHIICAADVCVCPDPKNGLNEYYAMNKILEYMALAKPIVAFDLAETRYLAQEAAIYAEPNDADDFGRAILHLLADPRRRDRMGRVGRNRIESTLGWSFAQQQLLKAYRRALSSALTYEQANES